MYAADAMTIDELKGKLSQLDEQRVDAEQGLRDAQDRTEKLAELERDRGRTTAYVSRAGLRTRLV